MTSLAARPSGVARQPLLHVVLIVGAVIYSFPLIWMLLTSIKSPREVLAYPPHLLPSQIFWQNYPTAMQRLPFAQYFRNSLTITVATVIGSVLSCTVVAYAFAKLRFPGRDVLFLVVLSTLMMPDSVRLVPTFLLYKQFGWINTFYPLIVPSFFGNAFYIFLLRQFFLTIPNELIDAARIDGASELRILRSVVVPLSKPALTVVGIFAAQTAWNDFLWPLVFLHDESLKTVTLGLYSFKELPAYATNYNELMAAAAIVAIPMILVFVVFQRYFLSGISLGGAGVKG